MQWQCNCHNSCAATACLGMSLGGSGTMKYDEISITISKKVKPMHDLV
jgi:hypothetical protein